MKKSLRTSLLVGLLTLVGVSQVWAGLTATEVASSYTPTQIMNGSFDVEPWMTFTYNGVTYTSCKGDDQFTAGSTKFASSVVFNGVDGGWNTTETSWFQSSLFEYICQTSGVHSGVHNSTIIRTDKYVEMNCYHACMLYQDLTTKGGDIIRWTLDHAVRTNNADEVQPMRVEIGAPNRDGSGNIVNASGWADNLNTQMVANTVAQYRYNGVTNPSGATYGYGNPSELQNLRLTITNNSNGWWNCKGVYIIPEGQTITRFGFISEAATPNVGNLLDNITFSTLLGNLKAVANANGSATITGYWGDSDNTKHLMIKIGNNAIPVDMTNVRNKNFSIVVPAITIGAATSITVYHQDYTTASKTITITPTPITESAVSFIHNQYKGYQQSTNHEYTNYSALTFTTNSDWVKDGDSWANDQMLSNSYQTCIKRNNIGCWAGELMDWFTMAYTVPAYSSAEFTTNYQVEVSQYSADSKSGVRAAYFDYGTDANNYWAGRNKNANGDTNFRACYGFFSEDGKTETYGGKTVSGESVAAWIYKSTGFDKNVSKTVNIDNSTGTASKTESRYGAFASSKCITANDEASPSTYHYTYLNIKFSVTTSYYKHVTFNANNGTGTAMAKQVIKNSGNLTANTYTRDGYTFIGWNTAANGSGTDYTDGQAITATSSDKGEITLYAQWRSDGTGSTVSFTHNQYKGYQESTNHNYTDYTALTFTTTSDWVKFGDSWAKDQTLSDSYQTCIKRNNIGCWAGELMDWFTMAYTVPAYSSAEFTTNYQVEVSQYSADSKSGVRAAYFDYDTDANSYWSGRNKNANGDTNFRACYGFFSEDGKTETYGGKIVQGESVAAWIYKSTGFDKNVSKTVNIDNSTGTASKTESRYGAFASSKCITANDEASPSTYHYTYLNIKFSVTTSYYKHVTFNANNGTGTAMAKQIIKNSGNLTANTYTRDGYTFIGWNTAANGSGTAYTDGQAITATSSDKGEITLYAQWRPNTVSDGTGQDFATAKADAEEKLTSIVNYCAGTKTVDFTISRTIYKDGYFNTLCLPFDATADQIAATFGEAPKELKKYLSCSVQGEGDDREIIIDTKDTTGIKAGEAYLISFENGTTLTSLTFHDVKVTITNPIAQTGELYYQGVLAPVVMEYDNQNLLFVGEQNRLYWPKNDGTFLKGFRAYFKVTGGTVQGAPVRKGMKASFGTGKTVATGVNNLSTNNEVRKLIQQGRVVIRTNGVMYDMNGNIVK